MRKEIIQIIIIVVIVRVALIWNFSGLQIARYLSTAIIISVYTETATETFCNRKKKSIGLRQDTFSSLFLNFFFFSKHVIKQFRSKAIFNIKH